MSRNAIAAMAVIFVSGFAGCAATARATEASVAPTQATPPITAQIEAPRTTLRDVVAMTAHVRALRAP
ncbi:MAG: hypothetical protein JNM47_00735 [Hyphomonadaceae bacterium]|nr:hypothetical protein [Hyphomonadaceae bacterium]